MQDICSYSQKFIVTIYDIDIRGNLKPSSILNYFQEVATRHAIELKVDYYSLIKQNEYWVLSRICAEIDRYPKLGDEITVVTYPIAPRMIDCDRDYYILDKYGNVIIKGVSKWLILDSQTHKIKRINPQYFNGLKFIDKRAIQSPDWKVEPVNNMTEAFKSRVRLDDIDINRHMNNAKYANIAYNALEPNDILDKNIKEFSVNYLYEMKYNKDYTVKKIYNNEYDVIIEIECEDRPAFRTRILFDEK